MVLTFFSSMKNMIHQYKIEFEKKIKGICTRLVCKTIELKKKCEVFKVFKTVNWRKFSKQIVTVPPLF